MRNSPVRHSVKSYKRDGKAVRSYIRGFGVKKPIMAKYIPYYLAERPSKAMDKKILSYKFPHMGNLEKTNWHCPTCICDLTDQVLNLDPEESDDHCETCTCNNPNANEEITRKIVLMKKNARDRM